MGTFKVVKLVDNPVQLTFTGGVNPQGAYNAGTSYVTGDSVSYNGSSYVAIQATTGNLPTNTTYWQLLASKGDTGATGSTGPAGVGIPTGGLTAQVLQKASNTDYDTEWATVGALTDGDKGDITVSASGATWTIDNEAVTFAKMQHIGNSKVLGRHTTGAGEVEQLGIDGGLEISGSNIQRAALTGAITASAGNNSTALGSFTLSQLNTALSDADVATGGGTASGTNTGDVTLAGTLDYLTLSGQQITRGPIDLATDVTGDLPFSNIAQSSGASVLVGRGAGSGAGDFQEITLGTNLSMSGTTLNATGGSGGGDVTGPASSVNNRVVFFDGTTGKLIKDSGLTLSGSNTGDQTITLTGDVTGSGTGSFAATIANSAVTLAKQADVATGTVFYRKTAGTGAPEVQTLATLKTDLGLTGTNSGDQTSIVGITGTKAQFDTAVTDGNFLYVGDVTQYTDEQAQDAVGAMVDTTLVYTDATPLLSRAALTGAITASAGSNTTALGSFTLSQLNTALSDADVATGGGTATGTNTGDQTITLTGDVTGSGTGSFAATIANDAVTNAKMANMAANTIKGRITASTGDPEDLTGANVRTITGLATTDSPQFAGIELGNASDTTLTRSAAGVLAVEGNDVAFSSNVPGVVIHGATAGTSRPSGYAIVIWIGSVEPSNATNNDMWMNTA